MKELIVREKGIFLDRRSEKVTDILEGIRTELTGARGQLFDIGHEFTGLRERLESAEGSITLIVSYLFHLIREIKTAEANRETDS